MLEPGPDHRPRLIAADLDGTLLRSDGTVSARTRAALAQAHDSGLIVVFVTARPPRRVREIALDAGIGGLAICSNGALLYDLATELVVEETLLEAALACELVAALRTAAPGVCFAVEAGLRYGQEPGYAVHSPHAEDAGLRYADALDLCAEGVTKLIVLHPTWLLDDLLRLTHHLTGATASVTHSGAPFVEVAAPGVTKARALAAFCARHAIGPESVIAFGDMPNDLPMLHWAGHSVAVANAHPDVLAAAHEVTRSNDEDGVAVVIERLNAECGVRSAE